MPDLACEGCEVVFSPRLMKVVLNTRCKVEFKVELKVVVKVKLKVVLNVKLKAERVSSHKWARSNACKFGNSTLHICNLALAPEKDETSTYLKIRKRAINWPNAVHIKLTARHCTWHWTWLH